MSNGSQIQIDTYLPESIALAKLSSIRTPLYGQCPTLSLKYLSGAGIEVLKLSAVIRLEKGAYGWEHLNGEIQSAITLKCRSCKQGFHELDRFPFSVTPFFKDQTQLPSKRANLYFCPENGVIPIQKMILHLFLASLSLYPQHKTPCPTGSSNSRLHQASVIAEGYWMALTPLKEG